ncbi:hypothetical protein [Paenarthrobacter sp. PH39-S1]|uniref:AMIN-like domain-containing (lipo)protein n=1 Tax=Paenarthrobacter sp. PH39-S1 TaxID=3046204 RepID=UPI0024BB5ED6|nr:hypothetical protein [Paenarthrobacter sp. PH39-S1]MDJ0355250.1 hypothetical protein [Paenarthrobacter sp. PH39-S1]
MQKIYAWLAAIVLAAGLGLLVPGPATAAPYCGITWGSLDKSSSLMTSAPIAAVRAGQHDCYDRLVIDIGGKGAGYNVRYVDAVYAQGSGRVVPLMGGAFLSVTAAAPGSGMVGNDVVTVAGYQTFREVAYAGSLENRTTFGLGVRARLPFEVFTLDGPGGASRLVIDVAHYW